MFIIFIGPWSKSFQKREREREQGQVVLGKTQILHRKQNDMIESSDNKI